jgi:hypothetical protein
MIPVAVGYFIAGALAGAFVIYLLARTPHVAKQEMRRPTGRTQRSNSAQGQASVDKEKPMSEQSPQMIASSASAQMFQLILGLMTPQAIHVAAKLGIADIVATAPGTAEELAAATKTDAPSLQRLLRFLASVGVFSEDAAGKYQQTPLSDTLRTDHPQSVRGVAIAFGSEFLWRAFGDLSATIATGQPAFNHVFGTSLFEYLAAHPNEAAVFNAAMTSVSSVELSQIVAAYDFSKFEQIVDVGGGHGALLYGILAAYPNLRGVLFDLPSVVTGASLEAPWTTPVPRIAAQIRVRVTGMSRTIALKACILSMSVPSAADSHSAPRVLICRAERSDAPVIHDLPIHETVDRNTSVNESLAGLWVSSFDLSSVSASISHTQNYFVICGEDVLELRFDVRRLSHYKLS